MWIFFKKKWTRRNFTLNSIFHEFLEVLLSSKKVMHTWQLLLVVKPEMGGGTMVKVVVETMVMIDLSDNDVGDGDSESDHFPTLHSCSNP